MPKTAQNTRKTPRGKPFQKGGDSRINAGGRPKNEQSITYWLHEFGNLTPAQLADQCAQYAAELKKVKGDMPMFAHIAIRALMGQINEPTPGLFALILERTEGKVKEHVELSGDGTAAMRIEVIYANRQIDPTRAASSANASEAGSAPVQHG